jgi:hypothetical protein
MHYGTTLLPLSQCRKIVQKHSDSTYKSNTINNIQHTIPLVMKPKLAYVIELSNL